MSEPGPDPPDTSPGEPFRFDPESSVPLIDQIINSALKDLPPAAPVGRPIQAARVCQRGCSPVLVSGTINPPVTPGTIQVKVLAVGIWKRVRDRVDADNPVTSSVPLPLDPSVDGVVQDETTGDIYYVLPRHKPRGFGLLSSYANIPKDVLFKLSGIPNPILVAGVAGTWLTCWSLLLTCHKRNVIIIGATTCLGRAAGWIADWLGASSVLGLADEPQSAIEPIAGYRCVYAITHFVEFIQVCSVDQIHIVIDFLGWKFGEPVLKHINNNSGSGVEYMPAWTQHENEPWEVGDDLLERKGIQIVDPALEMWRLTDVQLRQRLRFGLELMRLLPHPPFEIVARPMSEVKAAWDEEQFKSLKKTLVLVPGGMGGEGENASSSEQAQEPSA